MKSWSKRIAVLLVIVLLGGMTLSGCGESVESRLIRRFVSAYNTGNNKRMAEVLFPFGYCEKVSNSELWVLVENLRESIKQEHDINDFNLRVKLGNELTVSKTELMNNIQERLNYLYGKGIVRADRIKVYEVETSIKSNRAVLSTNTAEVIFVQIDGDWFLNIATPLVLPFHASR